MPGRKYSQVSSIYRYGFNGKENDNEIKGEANQQDYGMRIYDPRLSRFLSVDPITDQYPMLTPYQFASNRPIDGIDHDGGEWKSFFFSSALNSFKALLPVGMIMQIDANVTAKEYAAHGKNPKTGYLLGYSKAPAKLMGSLAIIADAATGFQVTKFATTAIVTGHLYHNGTSDPVEQKRRSEEIKGDAAGLLMGYGLGKFVGGVFKLMAPVKEIKIDLMGGPKTNQKGFINFDPKATVGGINDEVKNFGNYFGKSTVSEIVVNNPQATFLESVTSSLKPGGTITLRGTMSNKYFNSIYNNKAAGVNDFIITETKATQTTGFFKTNGEPIRGEIKELILKKK